MTEKIKLIVGLANPEAEYEKTRHNAGAWVIQALLERYQVSLKKESKFAGWVGQVTIEGQLVRLLIPTTYMNLSGQAVAALANFYQLQPEEILVIHDELDLPVGCVKIKQAGGHGGHNGLRDIISKLGNNKSFYRLRVGIDHPGNKNKVTQYVLGKPSVDEKITLDRVVDASVKGIELLFQQGLTPAQNYLHALRLHEQANI